MKANYITSIILFLLTSNIFSQTTNKNDFIFPLNITTNISGSFAELRSNHFHSGIDLSTNGETGIPVKCMADGVVSRIKISPVGYGNAIYIKHNNGFTTVYGHLKAYANKIDSIITNEQYLTKSFAIDYFPSSPIYVKQDEIIGYSGNSGSSGGPHLHYEIRDTKTEEPLNPFSFQSVIKDDVRPKLLTLRLYPLDSNSRINGDNTAKNYTVIFYDGKYHLKGNPTINASGNIGIGIEMLDYFSGSWKKCGVYSLTMKVNDKTTYSWSMDRFSFDESRYINSHIDYAYKTLYGKRFERCFRLPNNQLSIYNKVVNDGIIIMDSTKNIQILASDAANNLAELNFKLNKSVSPNISSAPIEKNIHLLSYNILNKIEDKSIQCIIPQGTFYENTEFIIKEEVNNNKLIFHVGNESIPLHKNITLKIEIPDTLSNQTKNICLAQINKSNHLSYSGGIVHDNELNVNTRNAGDYTFHIDSIKPTIKSVNFLSNKTYSKTSRLTFKISDDFSGIKLFNVYFNGLWTLFEYDAKTNTLSCPLSKAPKECNGKINIKIEVEDQCNNKTIFEDSFILKP